MTTVGFKKTSIATPYYIQAVRIHIDYENEEKEFVTIDKTRIKKVYAAYKRWEIVFGLLAEADMDYLEELTIEEAPQMILSSVTYDITTKDASIRPKGTTIVVLNRDPET